MHALIWKLNYVHFNAKHQHNVFHHAGYRSIFARFVSCLTNGNRIRVTSPPCHSFLRFDMCHCHNANSTIFGAQCAWAEGKDIGQERERHSIMMFSLETANWNESLKLFDCICRSISLLLLLRFLWLIGTRTFCLLDKSTNRANTHQKHLRAKFMKRPTSNSSTSTYFNL